jgi:hypothetical protein
MTILIAHRGNWNGINKELENTSLYLWSAVNKGFDIEVDIWFHDGKFLLGHDRPTTYISFAELQDLKRVGWFHAKNYSALVTLMDSGFNTFFHNDDALTITSNGVIWSHRGLNNPWGIVCMPNLETEKYIIRNAYGVCHDYLDIVEQILADGNTN